MAHLSFCLNYRRSRFGQSSSPGSDSRIGDRQLRVTKQVIPGLDRAAPSGREKHAERRHGGAKGDFFGEGIPWSLGRPDPGSASFLFYSTCCCFIELHDVIHSLSLLVSSPRHLLVGVDILQTRLASLGPHRLTPLSPRLGLLTLPHSILVPPRHQKGFTTTPRVKR